jgi:hypothetical protein
MALMTVKTMGKRGNKRMRTNRSRAESVAWPLMGGPKRKQDLQLSILEYFGMGLSLAGELARRMKAAKLPVEDGEVYMAGTAPNFNASATGDHYRLTVDDERVSWSALDAALRGGRRYTIVGLVICVRDREKADWLVFSRPFIVSKPGVTALLENVVKAIWAGKITQPRGTQ